MTRRGMLVLAWAGATVVATLVAWAAVQQVTVAVSPTAALPLPTVVAVAEPAGTATDRPAPAAAPPGDGAAPDPAEQPAGHSEGYELVGGAITVRYRSGETQLVAATPNSGFTVDVHDSGPEKVDVRFRSDSHESRIVARIRAGRPDPQRDERPR